MGGLGTRLLRARAKLFGSAAKEIPVPFEVPCRCGGRVAGIRRLQYQIAVCSACGTSVFILPVNVYPATKRIHSEVPDAALSARATAAMRELAGLDANPVSERSSQTRHDSAEKSARRQVGSQKRVPASPAGAEASDRNTRATAETGATDSAVEQQASIPVAPRIPFKVRLRRTFAPFRLLVASSVILLMITALWMVQRQQLETARKTWRREMDLAQRALTEKNSEAFMTSLEKAVDAAGKLRRTDSEARMAASLLGQCRAINQLSAYDPLEAITAAFSQAADAPIDLNRLNSELKDVYLVFESPLILDSDNADNLRLELPLMIQSRSIRLHVSSPLLTRLCRNNPATPVLFLAKIQSCRGGAADGRGIVIELDGSSVTLLTSEFLAGQAGYDSRQIPELAACLQRQQSFMATGNPDTEATVPEISGQGETP